MAQVTPIEDRIVSVELLLESLAPCDRRRLREAFWVGEDACGEPVALLVGEAPHAQLRVRDRWGITQEAQALLELVRRMSAALGDHADQARAAPWSPIKSDAPSPPGFDGPPTLARVLLPVAGDSLHHYQVRDASRDVSHVLTHRGLDVVKVEITSGGPNSPEREFDRIVCREDPVLVVPCVQHADFCGGELQQLLELRGVPFLGAAADVIALCCNRLTAKNEARRAGLRSSPTVRISRRVAHTLGFSTALAAIVEQLGSELLVRPLHGPGSLGTRVCREPQRLADAIASAFLYTTETLLIERHIEGARCSALVAGASARPQVIAISERVGSPDSSLGGAAAQWREPDHSVEALAREASLAAFRALGCSDVAVIEVIVDANGLAWFHDVDVMLDLRFDGEAACIAQSAGVDFADVLAWVVSQRVLEWPLPVRAA